jgi:hypothetical protein
MILAVALFLAQSVAVVHALSHARSGADGAPPAGHHLPLCAECAALAGLLAGPTADMPRLVLDTTVEAAIDTSCGPLQPDTFRHAYRSRAPPA